MNLGQGVYEEAYKKIFIKEYLKIVKKELGVNYLSHAVQKFLWKWLLTVVTITHL